MPTFKSNQTTRKPHPEGATPIMGEVATRKRTTPPLDDRAHVLALHAEHGNDRTGAWALGIGGSLTAEQCRALGEVEGEAIWWPFGRSGNPLDGYDEPQRVQVLGYRGWEAFGYSATIRVPAYVGSSSTPDGILSENVAHLYPVPAA